MKDYDEDVRRLEGTTRSFSLRGIEFKVKPLMPHDAISDLSDLQTGKTTEGYSPMLVSVIRRTLVPESRKAWDDLMKADLEVPISLQTLTQLADDLVAEEAGRPTQPPSSSTTTGGNTGTQLTDGSGSLEEAASRLSPSAP